MNWNFDREQSADEIAFIETILAFNPDFIRKIPVAVQNQRMVKTIIEKKSELASFCDLSLVSDQYLLAMMKTHVFLPYSVARVASNDLCAKALLEGSMPGGCYITLPVERRIAIQTIMVNYGYLPPHHPGYFSIETDQVRYCLDVLVEAYAANQRQKERDAEKKRQAELNKGLGVVYRSGAFVYADTYLEHDFFACELIGFGVEAVAKVIRGDEDYRAVRPYFDERVLMPMVSGVLSNALKRSSISQGMDL